MGERRFWSLVVFIVASGCAAHDAHQRVSGWLLVDTRDIRLRTNVSRSRATRVALDLQRLRDVLAGSALQCRTPSGADRIRVTMLPASEFREVAPEGSAAFLRSWTRGWVTDYSDQIVLPDNLGRDVKQVFQHELTHHLVASCFPAAPRWLNEGFAKFFETATLDDRRLNVNRDLYEVLQKCDPREEVVVDEPVFTPAQARERAIAILMDRQKEMVKASGTYVGLADLRAGQRVQIEGFGARFSGTYFITDTTHTIGDSGYTTKFNARREDKGKGGGL